MFTIIYKKEEKDDWLHTNQLTTTKKKPDKGVSKWILLVLMILRECLNGFYPSQ